MPSLLNMKPEELRWAITRLLVLRGQGIEDDEIAAQLGLDHEGLGKLEKEAYDREGARLREHDSARVFIDYLNAQKQCIADLNDVLDDTPKQQSSAKVGAIKARSDIYDKIVAKGQELGFIEKKPEEQKIVGGLVVANLSNEQLQGAITRELGGLDKLMRRFGGEADLLELEAGPIHRDGPVSPPVVDVTKPKKTPVKVSKTNKSRHVKTHKGRRVVKKKLKV